MEDIVAEKDPRQLSDEDLVSEFQSMATQCGIGFAAEREEGYQEELERRDQLGEELLRRLEERR